MATKKETNSTFFTFSKIGDSIKGKLEGFYAGTFGLVAKIAGKSVTLNKTQLMNIIGDNRKVFKAGKNIAITLIDEKKVKGQKHKAKIFTVIYDGKELKAENNFELAENLADKKFDVLFEK